MTREGKDRYFPQMVSGPKAMLINEYAGSGGDALPWMFRRLGTGPLIGTRTWGGLIGIGGYPTLMDGGTITAPRFAIFNPETGEFDVENKGVAPDFEVELDPAAPMKRPKYPVYNWTEMRQNPSAAAKQAGN